PACPLHLLNVVLLIVAVGLVLGVLVGKWLGTLLTGLYAELFHFPTFEHQIAPWLLATCAATAVATAIAGTLNAILSTVRLAPAEAMRPPAPGNYRRTLLERLGIDKTAQALLMIVRNMERRPLRTELSITGVAAALPIALTANFCRDALDV